MSEYLRELTYPKKLFSNKQLFLIVAVCQDKKSYPEIARDFNITESTVRKYLEIIRKKLSLDLCTYAYILKNAQLDLALLWKNTPDYAYMKEFIATCQQEPDNIDLDNDSLETAIQPL